MTNKLVLGVALVGLVLGLVGVFRPIPESVLQPPLGAVSGPDQYNPAKFYQGITEGGTVTLSGATAVTMTAAQVCSASSFLKPSTGAGTTTTLPTALALGQDCLKNTGDIKKFVFANTSGVAGSTTIIQAADASTTIKVASAVAATSTATLNGGNVATITLLKTGADTMTALISAYISQ
jgi:hypothetical protein